jgi:hypothetical protein
MGLGHFLAPFPKPTTVHQTGSTPILYGILFLMFLGLLILGFTVPQPVLDENEIYFLLIIMPIMGILCFWAYLEGIKGN